VDPPDRHLEDQGRYYQQTDKSGYDFISQFGTTVPAAYTVTVKMRGLADSLNSGVMIGQPTEPVNLYETAVRTIYWVELA